MTREEAIRLATGLRTDFKCESETMVDFCNTIIQTLEQEPCEDAISRRAAIDAVEKAKTAMSPDGEIYVAKINAEMNIQQLPSVSAKKTGRWIYICNSEVNGLKIVKCSECGKRTYGSGKYCPNCGAKMGVEE